MNDIFTKKIIKRLVKLDNDDPKMFRVRTMHHACLSFLGAPIDFILGVIFALVKNLE